MRTDKELIVLLLSNMSKLKLGFCHLLCELEENKIITYEESIQLYNILHKKTKKENFFNKIFYKKEVLIKNKGVFFWIPGDKEPRIRFLIYLLKLKQNEK